jgi:hypothetical protein
MTVISWKARHPDRHECAVANQTSRLAQKFVSGRTTKEALMPRVREVAAGGGCEGWQQVLEALERDGLDVSPLKVWGTTRDKSEIDRLCGRKRGSRLGSRPFRVRDADGRSTAES